MIIKKLGEISQIEISNVDKKTKEDEKQVSLCNFVDVYYNWAITREMVPNLMQATAKDTQIEKFKLKKGQVAITKDSETRDDIGVAAYIADNMPDVILGYHCILITPNEDILVGKYLNALLHTSYAQKYFEANASGSGQRYTLTNEIVANFPVPLIDISKQIEIGNIFSNIDSKISLNNSICSDLEAMAKQLYDYWFVQFDFPDENGKPYKSSSGKMVWNEELKREIPEGWKTTTIGNITNCYDSKRVPLSSAERERILGDIPYYGATGIMGHVNKAIFNGNYVLMAEDGSVMDEQGFPILQRVYEPCWINNHAHVLEPTGYYSCKLLMLILKTIPVVKIKTGSIQMKINQENMKNYKIVAIPKEMAEIVNSKLSVIENKLLLLEKENQQLTSLRDFLLPMLMNGQVKVK